MFTIIVLIEVIDLCTIDGILKDLYKHENDNALSFFKPRELCLVVAIQSKTNITTDCCTYHNVILPIYQMQKRLNLFMCQFLRSMLIINASMVSLSTCYVYFDVLHIALLNSKEEKMPQIKPKYRSIASTSVSRGSTDGGRVGSGKKTRRRFTHNSDRDGHK